MPATAGPEAGAGRGLGEWVMDRSSPHKRHFPLYVQQRDYCEPVGVASVSQRSEHSNSQASRDF